VRTFVTTIDIEAPPQRVFDVMSDIERWHEWTASISSITPVGDGRFAEGNSFMIRQPKFPPAMWKITNIEPGKAFTWTSSAPGFRAVGTHSVGQSPTGSRATLLLQYHGLLGGVFGSMTKAITERYIGLEARGLKARSENPDFHHEGARLR
jgi:uncharacterized protein YndB with AHSA1/START domain